jgi:hypothetical protein
MPVRTDCCCTLILNTTDGIGLLMNLADHMQDMRSFSVGWLFMAVPAGRSGLYRQEVESDVCVAFMGALGHMAQRPPLHAGCGHAIKYCAQAHATPWFLKHHRLNTAKLPRNTTPEKSSGPIVVRYATIGLKSDKA